MVSVIVPIYQAEKFIGKCVESILEQTYSDFELILVDDGSSDASFEICSMYAREDSRIVLIRTENLGSAHARNAGLKCAKGEYISFVDADDYLEPEFLRKLVLIIQQNHADVVECDFFLVEKNMKRTESAWHGQCIELDKVQAMREHLADQFCRQIVWNKLYRKTLVQDKWFVEGKTIDDEFWTYKIIGSADKIIHVSEPLYNYVQHEESVMHRKYGLKRLQALEAQALRLDYIRNEIPELKCYVEEIFWFACMYHVQMSLKYLDKELCSTVIMSVEKLLEESIKEFAFVKELSILKKIWITMSKMNFKYTCKIRNILKIGL